MRIRGFLGGIWQSLKLLLAVLSLTAVIALFILSLAVAEQRQEDLSGSLIFTIAILVGAILAAAALATLVHDLFANANRQSPHRYRRELGSVFERYVKWFTYVIGPVIASYGIIRIIEALK